MALMDKELLELSVGESSGGRAESWARVNAAWQKVVLEIALPALPTHPCATCGKLGMEGAKICGYCWTAR